MLHKMKQQVLDANRMLSEQHLVILTWGNVSQIDRNHNVIAIKPSGVPYENLKVNDIVLVDMEGKVIEGTLSPSSDVMTHIQLYKAFPSINGIVHTHSRYATIWAQAKKSIPVLGTTHADYFKSGIPCTRAMRTSEITSAYELETGNVIVETFKANDINPLEIPAVLVSSHGPFCWGDNAMHAVHHAMILEEVACIAYHNFQLDYKISAIDEALRNKHFERKHGRYATYGQVDNKKILDNE